MTFPVFPIIIVIVVFGAPYLVIYLQGRRLASIERKIDELTETLRAKAE